MPVSLGQLGGYLGHIYPGILHLFHPRGESYEAVGLRIPCLTTQESVLQEGARPTDGVTGPEWSPRRGGGRVGALWPLMFKLTPGNPRPSLLT